MLATRHLCGRTFNGTESENLERENCDLQLKTSASKWETEHTMLQFVALTDAEGETRVIIALVKKQKNSSSTDSVIIVLQQEEKI